MALTKIQSLGITDGTIVNADINASAAIAGTKLSGAGKVLQVVQTSITGNETTTSTSFVATTVSVSITPTSASNKVLILLTSGFWSGGSDQLFLQLRRGSSTVVAPYTGTAGSTTVAGAMTMFNGSLSTRAKESWNYNFLDSPSTTSATTYACYWKVNAGTGKLGKWDLNDDFGAVNTITAIEIAA